MSKLARVTQPVFAAGATNNGQFGSAQAGTKVLSNNLATIMSLSAWAEGWLEAVVGASKFPALEEFQAIDYVITTQLAYMFQEGVAEYDSGTTYYENSVVKQPGTFNLYGSLIDNNTGNALADPSAWKFLQNLAGSVGTIFTGSAPTGGSANAQTLTTTVGTFTLTAGNVVDFVAGATNTGAATIAVDGTSVTPIKKKGSSGLIDLTAGDITIAQAFIVVYDGVQFELQTSFNPAAFLQVANNLSDLGSAATALANLGALARSANLSDVANTATALANIGGRTAAQAPGDYAANTPQGGVGAYALSWYGATAGVFSIGTSYSASAVQAIAGQPWQGGGPNGFPFSTGTWLCMGFTPGSVGGWGGFMNFQIYHFMRTA